MDLVLEKVSDGPSFAKDNNISGDADISWNQRNGFGGSLISHC